MDTALQVIQGSAANLTIVQGAAAQLSISLTPAAGLAVTAAGPTLLQVTQTTPTQIEVTYGTQGPPGPAGISEEEMAYAKRTDFATGSLIYRGEAMPGTNENAPAWRIRRLTIASDDDVTEEWADGNSNLDNVWADRSTLSYV